MPYYCTLEDAKRQLQESGTSDDGTLWYYLEAAAMRVERYCGQNFDVRTLTRNFSGIVSPWDTRLPLNYHPLLTVTTLTNGNGDVIADTDYELLPKNQYPKQTVRLNRGSYWRGIDDPADSTTGCYPAYPTQTSEAFAEDAIEIAGTWGYVPHYPNCWNTLALTVSGAHTASTTTLTLSGAVGTAIDAGNVLMIGSEQMAVTAPIASIETASTLTVKRGYNGTVAASLLGGEAIKVFIVDPLVSMATAMIACAMYAGRNNATGDRVVAPNGVDIRIPQSIPQKAMGILQAPYRSWYRGGFA